MIFYCRVFIGLFSFFFFLSCPFVLASPQEKAKTVVSKPSGELKFVLEKMLHFLNSTRSLKGRFTQSDPYGEMSAGKFFLARPGKMRFEYDPPSPVLIIADGSWISIEDRTQKRTERYALSKTPLSFLIGQEMHPADASYVDYVEEGEDFFALAFADGADGSVGKLLLYFSKEEMLPVGWHVLDAQGKVTEVIISEIELNVTLDDSLFRIEDRFQGEHRDRSRR